MKTSALHLPPKPGTRDGDVWMDAPGNPTWSPGGRVQVRLCTDHRTPQELGSQHNPQLCWAQKLSPASKIIHYWSASLEAPMGSGTAEEEQQCPHEDVLVSSNTKLNTPTPRLQNDW